MSKPTVSEVLKAGQLPVKILDQEAYKKYLEISKHPILNDQKNYHASDGSIIPLTLVGVNLKNKIKHLPEEEQSKILVRKNMYYQVICKKNAYQRKAVGTIINSSGRVSSLNVFDQKKEDMIELFGRMFSSKEVHEICLTDWKLEVPLDKVKDFRRAHIEQINVKIEEHKRTFSDIRLGHKRSRLEELAYLYSKRKRIYEMSGKADDHRLLLSTLEQIRKESEGDSLRIDGGLNLSIEATIQQRIDSELLKNLNLKEIIVSRIAAKSNADVIKIVSSISLGYYRKFLDIQETNPAEATMPSYPSTQAYDFDRIKRGAEAKLAEEQIEMTKTVEISVEKKKQGIELKELLLQKMKGKSEELNYMKNNADGINIERPE